MVGEAGKKRVALLSLMNVALHEYAVTCCTWWAMTYGQ